MTSTRLVRRRLFQLALFACGALASAPAAAQPQGRAGLDPVLQRRAASPSGQVRVIVRLRDGADGSAAIDRVRGRAGARLPLVDGQVAEVSDTSLQALAADPAVLSVHVDRPIHAALSTSDVAGAAGQAAASSASADGRGIGIAVVDSGVAAHGDLTEGSGARRGLAGFVDFVANRVAAYDDYGHGTHVTGIIAGTGALSGGAYAGLAPGASILSLKVLDANGRGTISTAIAAIDYAIRNRARFNIRVLNLSVGAAVTESCTTDPFTLAARRAWEAGIVVVAAAGNFGKAEDGTPQMGGITAPGNAPWVVTVGAYSHMGTPDPSDDRVAGYSSRGPTAIDFRAKPDLVAPGTRIISLASPDSTLTLARPQDMVPGTSAGQSLPYLTMSGTSMAAPAVSAIAALMLQANPALTPNAVKAILQYTAAPDADTGRLAQGAGFLDAAGAVTLARFLFSARDGDAYPSGSSWGRTLIWGNHLVSGGVLRPDASAWLPGVVWGATRTGDNIVWGSSKGGDNIVWGSSRGGDNIVWGSSRGSDNIVWGSGKDDDNIVWGSSCEGSCDNIVWGSALDDNIVWGSGGDNIVWGSGTGENIVWGSTRTGDNIVWGSGKDGDNIVWGSAGENIVWGSACGGRDCDNIVWGSGRETDNIVWGSARDGDNIVWGSGRTGDNIVWGSGKGDNIVWGSGRESDNIVWGSGQGDNIVWGSSLADQEPGPALSSGVVLGSGR